MVLRLVNRFVCAEFLRTNKGEGSIHERLQERRPPQALQGVTSPSRICHIINNVTSYALKLRYLCRGKHRKMI